MRPSPRKCVNVLAVDTNVLLRYFADDVPTQAETAKALLASLTSESPGFIGREVALEVVWVLERSYNLSRIRIANAFLDLLDEDGIVVENAEDVASAVILYRESSADFSDLMILAAAKRMGARPLYTFDRKLARMEGATLLAGPLSR